MSNKWRHIGSAESAFGKFLPPYKELVENTETGKQRAIWVGSDETVGEAIAKGQWADDNQEERYESSSDSTAEDRWDYRNDQSDGREDVDKTQRDVARLKEQNSESSSSTDESIGYGASSSYTSTSEGDGSGAAVGLLVIIGIVVALWFGSKTDTDKQPANSNSLPMASPLYNSPQHEPEMLYVNTQQMKLREGPGVQYGDLGRISYGDAVVATETVISADGGNWVKVKTGNLEGWLNRKFLSATQPVLDGFNTLSVIIGNECYCGSHGGSFDATYNGKSITVSVSYNVTEANPVSHPLVISQKGHVTNDFSLLPCQSGENKCPDAGSMVQVTGNWTGTSDFEARQLDFPK